MYSFQRTPNPVSEAFFKIKVSHASEKFRHAGERQLAVAVRPHFGGLKAVVRPVPIPNTAVKRSVADGSSPIGSARVGSRQSFKKAGEDFFSGFLRFNSQFYRCSPKF